MSHVRGMFTGMTSLASFVLMLVLPLDGCTPGDHESQRSAGQRQAPEPQSSEPRTGAQEHDLPRAEAYGIPRDVEAWIEKEFVITNAPSLTMAVAKDGRLLWSRAWGWADKEQRVPATPRTPYIVASVSKAIMQREVFEPLGMTRSALGTPPVSASAVPASPAPAPAVSVSPAISYALDGSRLPAFERSTTAASSVFASAEDLVRFGLLHVKALALAQRAILSHRTIDMMQQRVAPSPFGMGWYVFDGPASGVVFHSGGMDGASAAVFLVPAQRLVVVGLCSTMLDLPGRGSASTSGSTSASAPIDRLAGPVTAWSFRPGRGADALPMYATLHRDRERAPGPVARQP